MRAGYQLNDAEGTGPTPQQRENMTELTRLLSAHDVHMAPSSLNSRQSAVRSFLRFCVAYGHEPCIPGQGTSTMVLCEYAIFLAVSGKHKSILPYLSNGCKYVCESFGGEWHPKSERPELYRTVRALDRVYGTPPKRKHPITITHLGKMAEGVRDTSDPYMATIWAAILVAFFAFLRKSAYCCKTTTTFNPVTNLTRSKLVERQGRYVLQITHSKTIQLQDRVFEVWLPKFGGPLCPHRALDRMLRLRRQNWGPINANDPLFTVDVAGTPLTTARFTRELTLTLNRAGISSKFLTPHSLRRGGTTFAFQSGCSTACIKMQGDWVSDAYLVYECFTDQLKMSTVQIIEGVLAPSLGPGTNPHRRGLFY